MNPIIDCEYCMADAGIYARRLCCYARAIVQAPTKDRRDGLIAAYRDALPHDDCEAVLAHARERYRALRQASRA